MGGFFFFGFYGGWFDRLSPSSDTVQVKFRCKIAFLRRHLEVGATINGYLKVLLKEIEGEGW